MSGVAVAPDKEAEMYESFCVFKAEPKNTCLRCRLGTISNNRAPSFSCWEPESLWIPFSWAVEGTWWSQEWCRETKEDRRLFQRYFSLPLPPAMPGDRLLWVCGVAKDTMKRTGSLGTWMIAIGPISKKLLCHQAAEEERNMSSPGGLCIIDFGVIPCFSYV